MEQQLDKYGLPLLESIPLGKSEYVMVKTRLQYFRKHYENASIDTDHVFFDGESIMCKTKIHIDGKLVATGMAYEEQDASLVNKTSFVECCETSSVGRALGMMAIGIDQSVDTATTIGAAIAQQEIMERQETLINYKADNLSAQLMVAIENDDEAGIAEVENDYRGDTPVAEAVKASLAPEHVEYMEERKERKLIERREKAKAKHEGNVAHAKAFADKQKNSEAE